MPKKIQFNIQEYSSLRNEITVRLSIINSQSNTALLTIISAWAAGIALKYGTNIEEIMSTDEIINVATLNFIRPLIFLIPILYLLPLAVKSGENLIQLASLSAYIRVFYDYLSPNKNKMNWETSNNILSNANIDRGKASHKMRFYNSEYTILAIISLLLYIGFAIISIVTIESLVEEIYYIFCIVTYVLAGICSIVVIITIYKSSSMKSTLMKYTPIYIEGYIKRAVSLGVIAENEVDSIKDSINPYQCIDLEGWFK